MTMATGTESTGTVTPPQPSRNRARRFRPDRDVREWHGAYQPYDLIKEFTVAFIAVVILVTGLSIIFSSPDEAPVTVKSWSLHAPVDFAGTAITELDGTSGTASYGPPYNNTQGSSQSIGFFSPQKWVGVHIPLNTAQDFVLGPLRTLPNAPLVQAAVNRYSSAAPSQQAAWTSAYETGVQKATFTAGRLRLPPGRYGPVAVIISDLESMARSGALDGALLASNQLYDTNYTKPLLFIADGAYLGNLAEQQHLTGDQWGMMNETGNYPGQAWLWLYTLWYQVGPIKSSSSADLWVWAIMMLLTVLLLLLPVIPGLRSIPRWVPVYRLVWRSHYRQTGAAPPGGPGHR